MRFRKGSFPLQLSYASDFKKLDTTIKRLGAYFSIKVDPLFFSLIFASSPLLRPFEEAYWAANHRHACSLGPVAEEEGQAHLAVVAAMWMNERVGVAERQVC